jgi:transcriptional regulator with XRE-family HTH domain
MQFGVKIRELRESQGLLQRQLAASLEIDTPMFSKIERGERKAKREQIEQLASLLHPHMYLWNPRVFCLSGFFSPGLLH